MIQIVFVLRVKIVCQICLEQATLRSGRRMGTLSVGSVVEKRYEELTSEVLAETLLLGGILKKSEYV